MLDIGCWMDIGCWILELLDVDQCVSLMEHNLSP